MIHIDFETRSLCDLKACGPARYASDPSTQILCLAYQLEGDLDVSIYAPWFKPDSPPFNSTLTVPNNFYRCPPRLYDAVMGGELIAAHNVFFEFNIWNRLLAPFHGWPLIPAEQWVCSMAQARYFGLPGGLAKASEVLGC